MSKPHPEQSTHNQQTNSPAPGNEPEEPVLLIHVQGWFDPDTGKLSRDVFEICQNSDLPETMAVKLDAPRYRELYDFIFSQARNEKRTEIAAEQKEALKRAEEAMRVTGHWCARILFRVSRHFGIRNAISSCNYFLRYRLAYIISNLASYQVSGDNVLLTGFADWFDRHNPLPTIPQLIHGQDKLIEITLRHEAAASRKAEYTKVYLPLDRIENTGLGSLLSYVWEPAEYIPRDVWLNFVIPQGAVQVILGIVSSCPWIPDQLTYVTEGEVWHGNRSNTQIEKSFTETRSFLVSQGPIHDLNVAGQARELLNMMMDPPARHKGPYHLFPSTMDLPRIRAASKDVIEAVQCVDERTWQAPSAWHAAFWLMNTAAGVGEGKPVYPAFDESKPLQFSSALLFRGQRNTEWPVNPRLLRESNPGPHASALAVFLLAMSALIPFEEMPILTAEAHIATAQHYGLATNLLDITVDPLTAVFFACDGAVDAEVVVYWLPLDEAISLGIRTALPPPWIERLYRQKGLFIDFFHTDLKDIKDRCYRILFPPDPAYLNSEYGNVDNRLYPDDPWLKAACEWAKGVRAADSELSPELAAVLAEDLRNKLGEPRFMYDVLFPARLAAWVDLFAAMLDWLALKLVDGKPEFQCTALMLLKRDNPGFFAGLMQTLQLMESAGFEISRNHDGLGYYSDAIKECLRLQQTDTSGGRGKPKTVQDQQGKSS